MVTILAVDDSRSLLEMIVMTYEKEGHRVLLAENADQALSVALSKHIDLILTDIHMPNADGITLVEALREIPDYANTPILVMTSDIKTEQKIRSRHAGATGWLSKPLSPERLLKALYKMLD